MKRVLYCVSPIGFGHASRAAAVGMEMGERSLKPTFATGGPAVDFLRSYGFDVRDVVTEPVPSESGGEMKRATIWYIRYWLGYRSTGRAMLKLIDEFGPDLVVGDEEFSSVSLAIEKGLPHALISDELELGFAKGFIARRVEGKAGEWYANLQRRVAHLLVPSFGEDRGNVHYVTPIVRPPDKTKADVRRESMVPEGARMVIFSSSGSGIGSFLLERTVEAFRKVRTGGDMLLVTGMRGLRHGDDIRELGVVRDNQNLIAAADLVVSTAGKSTIDEAASNGTPLIAIPIKHHAEQERNASELGFSPADINRMDELVQKYLGVRTRPANYQGAAKTADYLASLL